MKFKSLILFILFSLFLISCESKDKWINPYDSKADQSETAKVCKQNQIECGTVDIDYKGVTLGIDCGECSDGYECRFNTCWDINECDDPALNNCPQHSDCHNLDMESDGQPFECICKENYSGDDCVPDKRKKDCTDLPSNAEWNSVSSINQTWSGTEWLPSNEGSFNEEKSSTECRYKCKTNYTWTGSACKADSRTANCTGLPANAQWNTTDSIEQTWNGEEWAPSTKGTYNESKSSKECRFKCKNNFEWNGSECVDKTEINDEDSAEDDDDDLHDEDADSSVPDYDTDTTPTTPCDPNPCDSVTNSTGSCTVNGTTYSCGCNDGYFWNGSECKKQITLGNICTGQNRCFNNTEEIPCPIPASSDFYGQDAQYAKAGYCYPQSFTVKTVSGQNIVVDDNTGLEWQQVISEETFTWDDAGSYCENLEYGGYSDWRLPTPHELLTIIDNNKHDPAADASYFSFSSDLWTSKSYVTDTNKAFKLGFAYGYVWFYDNKTSELQAMCVRGNELKEPNFSTSTTNSNVVVKDSVTGLMWQKDYVTSKNWQEALKYCEDLTYAGKSDWRLPNKNELAALLNFDNTSAPYSDFTDMPSKWFWTSTTSNKLESIHQAWHTNFSTIYGSNTETKNDSTSLSSNAVRCVRSEKINDPCNPNPCNGVANSTQICTQHNAFEYSCGCNSGYFWNGQKCAVLPECSATSGTPCKDSTSGLTWSEKATETMPWQDAINYCNNDTEGGFSSWHLPNIDELRTIFIADRASACQLSETNNCVSMSNCWSCETCMETGIASTSGNTCSNWGTSYSDGRYSKLGETGWFWSSSTESASSNNAFGISFNVGGISDYERSYSHDVRCVRCEDGYYWNGSTCTVLPECSATSGTPCKDSTSKLTWSTKSTNTMNWQAAIDYCSTYSEGRLTGWHLPNIDELRTIIKDRKTAAGGECNVSETNNCLSQGSCWSFETCAEACNGSWDSCTTYNDGRYSKFGDTNWFFSSSTLAEDSNLAWRVGFSNGYIGDFNKSNSGNIRCVR